MKRTRLALFPGSFNPPTRAHIALMSAALHHADQVIAVLPRELPHKSYEGVPLDQRAEILTAASAEADFDVHISRGGLFIEIARECRRLKGENAEIWMVCGRDAAERIVGWDYGEPGAIRNQLEEFGLLVAARRGEYEAPPELRHRVRHLTLPAPFDGVSATEVRRRIEAGEPWQDLVPEASVELISRFYGRRPWRSK